MTSHKLPLTASALLALSLGALAAQDVTPSPIRSVPATREKIADEFIVHFKTRSYDLTALRTAIYAKKPAAEVDRIVAALAAKTERERAGFTAAIEEIGGKVVQNYWIINSSWIRIDADKVAAVAKLPNVQEIQPNWVWQPLLRDSTNASNHNSDAANTMLGTGGKRVIGTGLAAAVLDTGIDANMGGSGRPHVSFYRNGNLNDRTGGGLQGSRILGRFVAPGAAGNGEDDNSHGTMVNSCVGSAWGINAGFAPDAHLVSWKVSFNSRGSSTSGIIAGAWQIVLRNVRQFNIVAGNNSFSGSPSFTEATQRALGSAAFNGNILICVPSGNSGSNVNFTQAGYNGISVGSSVKNSSSISSFSGRGTQSSGKVIPDVAAIGQNVIMTAFDRETSLFRASGTSFASPSAAGAGLLIRHANAKLTALEAKALLLNHTRAGTLGGGRGAGIMLTNLAVQAAIKSQVTTSRLTTSKRTESFFFQVRQGANHAVTATWFRTVFSANPATDIDLTVFDPQGRQIGRDDKSAANSYRKVAFTAATTGTYKAVITGSFAGSSVDYAIAGAGTATPPKKPTLTGISPKTVPILGSGPVTLTGTELQTVDTVIVGSIRIAPKTTTATTVVFDPPLPQVIAPVQVSVKNPAGTSNSLTMNYTGAHPPIISADPFLATSKRVTDLFFSDKGWIGIYLLSGAKKPSKIPGLIDLGIGNNFTNLFVFHVFVANTGGQASLAWIVPPGLGGLTFHVQAAALAPRNPKLPLEVSNVVTRRVLF